MRDRGGIARFLKDMSKRNVREVDRGGGIGMTPGELFGHCASPVSAMRTKSFVTQLMGHQMRLRIVDAEDRSGFGQSIGETIARQVGHYDVEGMQENCYGYFGLVVRLKSTSEKVQRRLCGPKNCS